MDETNHPAILQSTAITNILDAIQAEGLTVTSFNFLLESYNPPPPDQEPSTLVKRVYRVLHFMVLSDLTLFQFLQTVLDPSHYEFRPYRAQWRGETGASRNNIHWVLNSIKDLLWTCSSGRRFWADLIESNVSSYIDTLVILWITDRASTPNV